MHSLFVLCDDDTSAGYDLILLKPLVGQKALDDEIGSSSILVQVHCMTSVWLLVRYERLCYWELLGTLFKNAIAISSTIDIVLVTSDELQYVDISICNFVMEEAERSSRCITYQDRFGKFCDKICSLKPRQGESLSSSVTMQQWSEMTIN